MSLVRLPRHASPKDVAKNLGVCTKTVRRWYKSGRLPAHSIGRRVVIPLREVEALLHRTVCVPVAATTVDEAGLATPFPGPTLQVRKRRALRALADEGPDDPEQVATLAALEFPGLEVREPHSPSSPARSCSWTRGF